MTAGRPAAMRRAQRSIVEESVPWSVRSRGRPCRSSPPLFVACCLVQVFLAGLGVFDDPSSFVTHRDFGYMLGWFTLAMLVLALVGPRPRRIVGLCVLVLVQFALQSVFVALRVDYPADRRPPSGQRLPDPRRGRDHRPAVVADAAGDDPGLGRVVGRTVRDRGIGRGALMVTVGRPMYDLMYRFGAPWEGADRVELRALVRDGRCSPDTLRRPGAAAARAVDLGCGSGSVSVELAEAGFEVTGIDFSRVALRKARSAAMRRDLGQDRVRFFEGDLTAGAVAGVEGPFDLLVDYGTLDDLPDAGRRAMACLRHAPRPARVAPVPVRVAGRPEELPRFSFSGPSTVVPGARSGRGRAPVRARVHGAAPRAADADQPHRHLASRANGRPPCLSRSPRPASCSSSGPSSAWFRSPIPTSFGSGRPHATSTCRSSARIARPGPR